jgi:hypothetical protein
MTTKTLDELFAPVENALEDAILIAFDGCHKMYVALDDEQADWFRENYAYNANVRSVRTFTGTPEEMLATLKVWWDESCGLKFINSVTTDYDDPNAGYTTLIGQGDWCEDDDEDDEDEE